MQWSSWTSIPTITNFFWRSILKKNFNSKCIFSITNLYCSIKCIQRKLK
jgi:hypothetical protein